MFFHFLDMWVEHSPNQECPLYREYSISVAAMTDCISDILLPVEIHQEERLYMQETEETQSVDALAVLKNLLSINGRRWEQKGLPLILQNACLTFCAQESGMVYKQLFVEFGFKLFILMLYLWL